MRPSLRPWAGVAVGVVAVLGLTGFVHVAAPAGGTATSGPPETITYELSGDAATTKDVHFGDVADMIYSPRAARSFDRVSLPWSTTVPLDGPLSMHDLLAWMVDRNSVITCTVRRNGEIIMTSTGRGGVFCDLPPG